MGHDTQSGRLSIVPSLMEKIIARIRTDGPLTVADYMTMCLSDPDAGYYSTKEPFGIKGDFITAPETSQMFGEIIGAVCVSAYEVMGAPEQVQLAELGPGRGTLMADFLRTAALRDNFMKAAKLNLVETSPRLRKIQSGTLGNGALTPRFHDRFEDIPEGPLILVANEFFDALPIHQFTKTPDGWFARCVGLSEEGGLIFGTGPTRLPEAFVPKAAAPAPLGTILETQPAANAIAEAIGHRIATHGGAALIIDYGYAKTATGDTLQALYKGAFDDPLKHPGAADITAHVNFEALAAAFTSTGAIPLPLLDQGDFLLKSGLLERAGALGAGKSEDEQEAIRNDVERLAAPEQMGTLFKVMAIAKEGVSFPPFH